MASADHTQLRLTQRLARIARAETEAKSGGGVADDVYDDWIIDEDIFEAAYRTWWWMKMTDYKHLPAPGGLLDQPARLMDAVSTIEWRYQVVKQHHEANLEVDD